MNKKRAERIILALNVAAVISGCGINTFSADDNKETVNTDSNVFELETDEVITKDSNEDTNTYMDEQSTDCRRYSLRFLRNITKRQKKKEL